MSYRISTFEKVSLKQFSEDINKQFGELYECQLEDTYNSIALPRRATSASAGYDFKSPINFVLDPGDSIVIPTGVRCFMPSNWVLMCFPRSGMGFKYQVRLANSTAIIDSDYSLSENEGHIMLKLVNGGDKVLNVNAGDGIAQGIFLQYGITKDDDADGIRNGGFGSTGR